MKMSIWIWQFVLICFLRLAQQRTFVIDGQAQGTTYHIKYIGIDSVVTKSQVDSILRVIDASLSLYKENSLINRFNASKQGIDMDLHFKNVILASLQSWKKSGGISDITVKPLVDLWGFGVKGKQPLPDSGQVKRAMTCVGANMLVVKDSKLVKKKECVQVDCNGIAQGYSVDVIANFLDRNDVLNYIVELGGEIRVRGKNELHTAWTIGIESPADADGPGPFEKRISLQSGAITSSGSYRKYFSAGGKQYSHIIDPRTGFPATNELISVSLIAPDATTADAYDNVLIVMGLKKSFEFLRRNRGMEAFFIYKKADGSVGDTATAGFYRLFKKE
jgi:thiamine biosynthesis lipoprotein